MAEQPPIKGEGLYLLPPAKHLCQTCATDHQAEQPHNAQSMFYQVKFQMEQGRSPDWRDAMAHCAEPVRERWRAELIRLGVDVDAGQVNPNRRRAHAG